MIDYYMFEKINRGLREISPKALPYLWDYIHLPLLNGNTPDEVDLNIEGKLVLIRERHYFMQYCRQRLEGEADKGLPIPLAINRREEKYRDIIQPEFCQICLFRIYEGPHGAGLVDCLNSDKYWIYAVHHRSCEKFLREILSF